MKIWYTVVVVQVLAHAVCQTWMPVVTFQVIDSRDMAALLPGWTAPLVAWCAVSCEKMPVPCYSFAYDEATSVCTSGAPVISGKASVSPFQGYLFSSIVCSKPGYTLHIKMDAVICLRVSSDKLNYSRASLACQAEGSHLLTLKTEGKLELFGAIPKPDGQIWVGLDDIRNESFFQWVDDDTFVTREFQKKIFNMYQPDNRFLKEDCVVYDLTYYPLNDVECDKELHYVCESLPTALGRQHAT